MSAPVRWRAISPGCSAAGSIDAGLLEELEARLLGADVGIEATSDILADLNRRVARRELADAGALLAALRAQLEAILRPCEQPLRIEDGTRPFVILVVGVNGSGKTTSHRQAGATLHRPGSEGGDGGW